MATTTTEILMQFIPTGEQALRAECTAAITGNDKLANLTMSGMANGFEAGRYFLVDTFKFGVELRDGETDSQRKAQEGIAAHATGKKLPPHIQQHVDQHFSKEERDSIAKGGAIPKLKMPKSFSRWRSAKEGTWQKDAGQHPYNAKIEAFSFSRRIDKSSITLFDYCCKQKSFAFASVVKRRSAPVSGSDLPEGQSYIRIDFKDVVISSLKWDDGDVVEESCTFHAKKMRAVFWSEKKMGLQAPSEVLSFLNATNWELLVKPASAT